jgi:hypothetical protein
MTYEYMLVVAGLNWVLCTALGWACLCRLNAMGRRTRPLYRVAYTALLAASTASGFAPVLWREWPGLSQVAVAAAALLVLLTSSPRWSLGAPDYTHREPT